MGAAVLIVCGKRIRPLERVARVGSALGMTRATSYRAAARDAWPMIGDKPNQYCVVPVLLSRMQIPYEYETDVADDEGRQ